MHSLVQDVLSSSSCGTGKMGARWDKRETGEGVMEVRGGLPMLSGGERARGNLSINAHSNPLELSNFAIEEEEKSLAAEERI